MLFPLFSTKLFGFLEPVVVRVQIEVKEWRKIAQIEVRDALVYDAFPYDAFPYDAFPYDAFLNDAFLYDAFPYNTFPYTMPLRILMLFAFSSFLLVKFDLLNV